MADQSFIDRLRSVLELGPPLRVAFLFGSAATGRMRADSDVDIGVLPINDLSLSDETRLAAALSAAASREVDLVRLDRADTFLAYEIATKGIPIIEQQSGTAAAFRADAISAWLDFDETIAPHRERFLARLARGNVTR